MFADAAGGPSATAAVGPWSFQVHWEVWLLVGLVVAMGAYVTRVIAPKALPAGTPAVTRRQRGWFVAGVVVLWLASDWPMHDIAEQHLYTVHMVQHMLLTFVMPPMFWLAMPEWLARLIVPDEGKGKAIVTRLAAPVAAGLIYNALMVLSHWSVIVNTSVRVGAVHYLVHLVIVSSAFLMWIPVCGPWKELRLSPIGQCIYLFLMSMLPTVPGAWLTLAASPLYEVYDTQPRAFGVSTLDDQSAAGLFMKVAGGFFLWGVIIAIFFRWGLAEEKRNRRAPVELSADERAAARP